MGADKGPAEVVRGVRMALKEIPGIEKIILVGREKALSRLIRASHLDKEPRLSIHPASEVIGMEEKPIESLRRKKDASMVRTVELMREGRCQAVVSCGNTGSLMACGTLKLRTMPGVERPALATVIPGAQRHWVLADVGANPVPKPKYLVHNAILGSDYARITLGLNKPRVGLISIGTEEGKGSPAVNEAHEMLKSIDGLIDYQGLVEGFQLFKGQVDVAVCDGFTGNVLLKSCEGILDSFRGVLKTEIRRTPARMLGGLLLLKAFRDMRRKLNPEQYGGALLLGLKGNIFKAHGSSNATAIMNAIGQAASAVDQQLYVHSVEAVKEGNKRIAALKKV